MQCVITCGNEIRGFKEEFVMKFENGKKYIFNTTDTELKSITEQRLKSSDL